MWKVEIVNKHLYNIIREKPSKGLASRLCDDFRELSSPYDQLQICRTKHIIVSRKLPNRETW